MDIIFKHDFQFTLNFHILGTFFFHSLYSIHYSFIQDYISKRSSVEYMVVRNKNENDITLNTHCKCSPFYDMIVNMSRFNITAQCMKMNISNISYAQQLF
jgi:hypothetical protein